MTQDTMFSTHTNSNELFSTSKHDINDRLKKSCLRLKSYGVHSSIALTTAGFKYTGDGDTARCDECNLEVSGWTQNMKPFFIHCERSPSCPFIRSLLPKFILALFSQENPAKRQKTETNSEQYECKCKFVEVEKLKEIRRRSYSHWSRQTKPSSEQMIAAGFFSCNVGDRVICLYCNLICQKWISDTDDPSEVHKTLSPKCPYVLSMLMYPEPLSTVILNDNLISNQTPELNDNIHHLFDQIVLTTPCHPDYSNLTKRLESFNTWSQESSPPVEELVRAGFFYTGVNNAVTCFYCSGSLQNWGANDNPVIEHARWFSNCAYAKQLCGDELYRKIQETKRLRRERAAQTNQSNDTSQNNNSSISNHRLLQIDNPNMLSRLVAARLDLSMSQNLLDQDFKLAVIKRSWEDQLQLKQDDFIGDSDLFISCVILQKQIDHIQGNKENIVVPSIQMKLIHERKQSGLSALQLLLNGRNTETTQNQSAPLTTSTTESTTTPITEHNANVSETNSTKDTLVSNPCIICCQEEKRLACIPCGHFTTCITCSHTLRLCPVCRKEIEAFVRIFT